MPGEGDLGGWWQCHLQQLMATTATAKQVKLDFWPLSPDSWSQDRLHLQAKLLTACQN